MRISKALEDLFQGIFQWRIWLLLGWQDIKLRYRRSYLGPLWITVSMIVTIFSMGFLYGHLFKMNLNVYFPHLAAGLLTWTLIASLITESTLAFIESYQFLKQIKLHYTVFIMRIITRNVIIFLHNLVAFIFVIFYVHIPLTIDTLLFIPGLLIIILIGIAFGMIIAIGGTRFRDISPIIASLTQIFFFLTPVIWSVNSLPAKYAYFVRYNPFAQLISLIRDPLLGHAAPMHTYFITIGITLCSVTLMLLLFSRVRHKIIYWL